ncbi:DUF998 domain-containing protein [Actinoplanes sp. L3-i22]|uniref:DUF998 domain-containing protein n=1 Tax=Actinoplanes sp. L3-i22 TaxID=2836373 RepID=UPI001C7968A9|nr:DUF998 domain-containing protein [Actinoplanes sp. L3-i22]BCY09942.1 hypothetical protein L3i22_050300 [Actinoplanes sp. L3-i22]
MRPGINRLAAAAGLVVTAGAGVMLFALVAGPGPWWRGYVSEAGAAGHPYAVVYRLGLVLLAAGVALLGRARPVIGPLLLVTAGLAGTSGVVACSAGCPLPPFEPTTPTDVVHAAASVLGMLVLAAAMAVTWWTAGWAVTRRLTAAALALTVPLGGALGLMMLFAGRGATSAVLERILLVIGVSWLVGTAAITSFDDRVLPRRTEIMV